MAIVVETVVRNASREQSDAFDASIEQAMMELGGPPAGLMVHFQSSHEDGFKICNVWTTQATMEPFYRDVVRPRLAAAGLEAGESVTSEVWGFARP